ncbi:MAG: 7-cyano-7-deazaguanine synthase QueC [Spirochaetes bacterium]|nr:7-cyano-7-deazaguanine synthase QueC [Spirochaetota bacterium]
MINPYANESALVLASGGMDSTVSLYWALKRFKQVTVISFDYNQKHKIELDVINAICSDLNLNHKVVDVSFIKDILVSNLFIGQNDVNEKHKLDANVPSSFVPYRNMLFLTVAAGYASTIGAQDLVIGVCETDYSGYADCRDVFIRACQVALNLSTDFKDKNLEIHTPLMRLTKSDEFRLAEELGCLDVVLSKTMTCYNGVETIQPYGKGCDNCPACILRKTGYNEYISMKNKINIS